MTRRSHFVHALLVSLLPACAAPLEGEPVEGSPEALTSGLGVPIADFNGDGFADLAVGVPNDDISTPKGVIGDAGSVHVFYGDGLGLSTANDVIWSQESVGVPGEPGIAYHFGAAVTVGDFNGDHISDLAIGAPGETVNGVTEAGTVTVMFGSVGAGLTTTACEVLTVASAGLPPRVKDHFGGVLAAGDVFGDGTEDLAIGVPEYDPDVFGIHEDGGIVVIAGRARAKNTFTLFQVLDGTDTPSEQVKYESFGGAVAFLDLGGDGRKDLAVGVPRGRFPNANGLHVSDAGYVAVYIANAASVYFPGVAQIYQQANWNNEEPGTAEEGDEFGASLAVGDFNGDGREDLAVGVPGEDWSGNDAGGISILYADYGTTVDLHSEKNEFFSQAAALVEGSAEGGDRFGSSLIAADFDDDGFADLAIGVPGEKEQGVPKAGAVNVLYGTSSGLSAQDDQFFAQDYNGLLGKPQSNEGFGSVLARGDFNTDGVADLVVGIPLDVVQALAVPTGTVEVVSGEIEILRGSIDAGLLTTGEVEVNREKSGVAGVCNPGDTFGASLGGG